jgi:hypothetical protein
MTTVVAASAPRAVTASRISPRTCGPTKVKSAQAGDLGLNRFTVRDCRTDLDTRHDDRPGRRSGRREVNLSNGCARDPVEAGSVDFLGAELQLEALAHHAGQKARSECCFQPAAFIIAATDASAGDWSIAIARHCLEPELDVFGLESRTPCWATSRCRRLPLLSRLPAWSQTCHRDPAFGLAASRRTTEAQLAHAAGGAGSRGASGARDCDQDCSKRARLTVLFRYSFCSPQRRLITHARLLRMPKG